MSISDFVQYTALPMPYHAPETISSPTPKQNTSGAVSTAPDLRMEEHLTLTRITTAPVGPLFGGGCSRMRPGDASKN